MKKKKYYLGCQTPHFAHQIMTFQTEIFQGMFSSCSSSLGLTYRFHVNLWSSLFLSYQFCNVIRIKQQFCFSSADGADGITERRSTSMLTLMRSWTCGHIASLLRKMNEDWLMKILSMTWRLSSYTMVEGKFLSMCTMDQFVTVIITILHKNTIFANHKAFIIQSRSMFYTNKTLTPIQVLTQR